MTGISGLGPTPSTIPNGLDTQPASQGPAETEPQLPSYLLLGLSPQTGGSAPSLGRFSPGDTSALIAAITLVLDESSTTSRNDATRTQARQFQGALSRGSSLQRVIAETEVTRDLARAELSQLQETRGAAEAQRAQLQQQSSALGERIAQLDAILAAPNPPPGAAAERAALMAEKQGVDGQIAGLNQQIGRLDQQIGSTQARVDAAQARIDGARVALASAFNFILAAIAGANGATRTTDAVYGAREQAVIELLAINDEIFLEIDEDTRLRELDREWRSDSDLRDQLTERLTRIVGALSAGVLDVRTTLAELLDELGAGEADADPRRLRLAL